MTELVPLDFETDAGYGARARIGIVVLETDHTIEPEAALLDIDDVAFYHARIPMEPEVSSDTLGAMQRALPSTAGLLPVEFEFAAVGYACTSAATVIGAEAVHACLHTAHPSTPATDPISAAIIAARTLGLRRLAVVTPYVEEVTDQILATFEVGGIGVGAAGSFLEPNDHVVAHIAPESLLEGMRTVLDGSECDGAFVSCTSLRTLAFVASWEEELGVPVLSSNQAFLWHLLRLAGVDDRLPQFGRLFESGLPRQ